MSDQSWGSEKSNVVMSQHNHQTFVNFAAIPHAQVFNDG